MTHPAEAIKENMKIKNPKITEALLEKHGACNEPALWISQIAEQRDRAEAELAALKSTAKETEAVVEAAVREVKDFPRLSGGPLKDAVNTYLAAKEKS